jgi:ribosomal-protein-alanine N-acetyltransferase
MNNQSELRIIETPHLHLIACEMAHLEAFLRDRRELERMLGITIPDNWPTFPDTIEHIYQHLKANPAAPEWGFHLFVHAGDRTLIGEGGFKGGPDANRVVEIGYAIIPEYRRRGLATEAARGLTRYAFSHPEVNIVQAHTMPDGTASINVLKKLGMKFMGTIIDDPEDGEVFQWRLERKEYSIAE